MKKYLKVLIEIIQNSEHSVIIETQDLPFVIENLEKESGCSFSVSEVFEYSQSKKGRDKQNKVPNQYYISQQYKNTPFSDLLKVNI